MNSFSRGGEGQREGRGKKYGFMLSLAAAVIPSQPSGLFGLASSRPCLSEGERASGRVGDSFLVLNLSELEGGCTASVFYYNPTGYTLVTYVA